MPKAMEKPKDGPIIRDSAYQIWLAGLGAFSLAEDESGKLFKALVRRGKTFEATSKGRLDALKAKLDVRGATDAAIGRIGDTLDDGVTDVLHRLGLPTKKEIEGLSKRVDRLTKTLESKPARNSRRASKSRSRVPETTATA